eukprot:scaffold2857_cov399-Prasinococcus_capsulatus_cf.AAC.5
MEPLEGCWGRFGAEIRAPGPMHKYRSLQVERRARPRWRRGVRAVASPHAFEHVARRLTHNLVHGRGAISGAGPVTAARCALRVDAVPSFSIHGAQEFDQ